jgi:hypothetical protein
MNTPGARQIAIVGLLISVILVAAQAPAEDWPKSLHDLNNSAHSGETGISSSNVQSLKTNGHSRAVTSFLLLPPLPPSTVHRWSSWARGMEISMLSTG